MQNNTKQFDGRWEQENRGVITMKTSGMNTQAWDVRHTEEENRQRRDIVCKSEHKLIQLQHLHLLPVLLMFLKLPKLFNFHILRLAAEREISTGRGKRRETEKDKYKC